MAQKKAKSTDTSMQDVAPPDTITPDSSSKPLIVTHRPQVQDPMMVETDNEKPELKAPSAARKIIAPTSTSTDEPASVAVAAQPKPDESLSVDGLPAATDKQDAKATAEHQAAIDKMVLDRKYFLPINQVEKRRNKRYTILGIIFIVVLGAAWLDISLDSGILTIPGVEAPTHFFR